MLTTHWHIHPDFDACLIRTAEDISEHVQWAPYLRNDTNIENYEGARCWNVGWGSNANDNNWATVLQSIGLNLLGRKTCQQYSYWKKLYDNEICGVVAPITSGPGVGENSPKEKYSRIFFSMSHFLNDKKIF